MRHFTRLGITGGIGSGKSTFAGMLQECGAALVDADQIARSVTEAGGPAIGPIRQRFGDEFIDAAGALDRARMRALAFSDAGARARLEAIIHPHVGQAIARTESAAADAGHRVLALDIPLLTESRRWPGQLDAVVVVDCHEHTQIERVRARSGLDEAAIRAIIATQSSRGTRLACADWVVFNDDLTLARLRALAHQLASGFGL